MSDTEQSPVTRDKLRALIDFQIGHRLELDEEEMRRFPGSATLDELLDLMADAILAEFTLTCKFEPAEVDPWVDPEPWVYVVTGKRAAHPLPQTYYRYAPRTHIEYNTEQEGTP